MDRLQRQKLKIAENLSKNPCQAPKPPNQRKISNMHLAF
jgi:hypothetical protein